MIEVTCRKNNVVVNIAGVEKRGYGGKKELRRSTRMRLMKVNYLVKAVSKHGNKEGYY